MVVSQLFDTRYRNDDYRREEEGRGERAAAIAGAARITKRKRTWEKCSQGKRRRKMRAGRERCIESEGRTGKMREEGNKEKRSKRVGSWPCGYDRRNEREREREGEGGN